LIERFGNHRTSAISAGAACSRPSSWLPIAPPASRSDPALKLNPADQGPAFENGLASILAEGRWTGRIGDHVMPRRLHRTADDIDMHRDRLACRRQRIETPRQ